MKRWFSLLIVVSLILSSLTTAFAWGNEGHKTVGQIAEMFLTEHHSNVLDRLQTKHIMLPGDTLSNMATWADQMKQPKYKIDPGALDPDPDTQKFLRDLRNKNHREWHYVDIPLDCQSYDACGTTSLKFNNATDVVQMINTCIKVLHSSSSSSQLRFTKRTALRLLIHFMGDLQQPLHVGSGFLNLDGPNGATVFATDPVAIKKKGLDSDHGGNLLLINGHKTEPLHGHWDNNLVADLISGPPNIPLLASNLKSGVPVDSGWDGQGQFKTWANQWASDSIKLSRSNAYDITGNGVTILNSIIVVDPQTGDETTKYAVQLAGNYDNRNKEIVRIQLVKGGYRLAKLLEAIFS